MMKQEAIVQSLFIKQIGQRVHFQMQLPHDANRIAGLEYGAIKTTGVLQPGVIINSGTAFQMVANKLIGRLTLQIPGVEGVFCQVDCKEERNISFGEFNTVNLQPTVYTHARKNEELAVDVNGDAAFIEGYYADSWGMGEYLSLEYTFHLYLWIEKCVL